MAKKLVEGIEQELTCAVCLDLFTEPKVLPCLHTYCKGCIDGLVAKSRDKTGVVCSKCRERCALPAGGVSGFISNFTLKNLRELMEVHQTTGSEQKEAAKVLRCENGVDENVAVARCLVCSVYLCDSCWKLHGKMAASRNHETVSLEVIKEGGEKKLHKPQYCQEHEGEVLKLYCRTCSKTICGDCTYVEHRDHKYTFIKNVREELRQGLEGTMEGLRKKASEFRDYLECLHKAEVEQRAKLVTCKEEVNRAFDSFVQRIQLCRDRVLEELEKTAKADEKSTSAEADATEVSLAKVSSNLSFIERLLKSGSDTEVALMAAPTQKRAKQVEGMQCERKPGIIDGTLNIKVLREVGRHEDKELNKNMEEIEDALKKAAHGIQDCALRPDDIVVKGIENLSCGPNQTFTVTVTKKVEIKHCLEVCVIHKAQDNHFLLPTSIAKTGSSSWAVSFLVREPGNLTITVKVAGITAQHAPFVQEVEVILPAIGTRVRRGPDWKWRNQDGGGLGTVHKHPAINDLPLCVKWDNCLVEDYRYGRLGRQYYYDLEVVQL